ncbi:hypothetical protein KEM54_006388 [Ascosphaera aggregata]|nr:hypothetical protein KEM54_006388 [Ascosphaera aggregata]
MSRIQVHSRRETMQEASGTDSSSPSMDAVLQMWERQKVTSPVYNFMLRNVVITHASPGLFKAQIQANSNHMNSHGSLHGVFSACVTDWAGGLAIATHGWRSTGVSVDIHVTYLTSAKVGDMLEIEATADKVGRNMAYTAVNIWKMGNGEKQLVAKGSHTKFVANAVRTITVETDQTEVTEEAQLHDYRFKAVPGFEYPAQTPYWGSGTWFTLVPHFPIIRPSAIVLGIMFNEMTSLSEFCPLIRETKRRASSASSREDFLKSREASSALNAAGSTLCGSALKAYAVAALLDATRTICYKGAVYIGTMVFVASSGPAIISQIFVEKKPVKTVMASEGVRAAETIGLSLIMTWWGTRTSPLIHSNTIRY